MSTVYTFNNKVLKNSANDKWLTKKEGDPLNPLNLPPNTVRVRTNDGEVPYKANGASYNTATLVPGTSDVYDVYKSGTSLYQMFYYSTNLIEVLGANTSNISSMKQMFAYCRALRSIPLFDTTSVTNMQETLFDCTGVQTGALALYQQASSQATPPSNHSRTFYNCGSYTDTGAAELAQIPSDWK